MISKMKQIKIRNREEIIEKISQLPVVTYDTVSKLVPKLLLEGALVLDHSVYIPFENSVGSHLVYDHPDKDNPFSMWAFAFAPRQKTSIHDHQYKGTVTVLEGPISERYFLPTSESSAQLVGCCDRYKFHSNRDDLNSAFVHQLKRRQDFGEGISVTLHIYNMEAYLVNQDGDSVDRRNLKQIYSRDKMINMHNLPLFYKEEHAEYSDQIYSL